MIIVTNNNNDNNNNFIGATDTNSQSRYRKRGKIR